MFTTQTYPKGIPVNLYNHGNTVIIIFTVVLCILILSKSFIYQLMYDTVALKEY